MRKLWFIVLLCSVLCVPASTPSYWFSGFQTKPDAKQAQEYFFLEGTNILFTYTNNRVIINSTGGGGGGTNAGPPGPVGPTGPMGPMGPAGSNGMNGTNGLSGTNGATGPTGPMGPVGSNGANGTNGAPGISGTNGATGPTGPAGPTGTNVTVGVTTNFTIFFMDTGQSNAVYFTNGLLTSIKPFSPAPFYPTNVTGSVLYLSYLDMPTNGTQYNWTNEISLIPSSQVWVNTGATYPTNSALGVYFPGNTANYFANATSGILFSNPTTSGQFSSIWITIQEWGTPSSGANTFLGNNEGYGRGMFQQAGSAALLQDGTQVQAFDIPGNVVWDVAYSGTNTGGIYQYTNGIFQNFSTISAGTGGNLWGIGRDADADGQAKTYIKFILFCTNYTFSASDVANLHAYSVSH